MSSHGDTDLCRPDFLVDRLTALEAIFDMESNCICDEIACFLLSLTFGVAPLQGGTDDDVPAVLVALCHHGELVLAHTFDHTPATHAVTIQPD